MVSDRWESKRILQLSILNKNSWNLTECKHEARQQTGSSKICLKRNTVDILIFEFQNLSDSNFVEGPSISNVMRG